MTDEEIKINKSAARQKRYREKIASKGGVTICVALNKEAADIIKSLQDSMSLGEIINSLIIAGGSK